MQKNMGGADRGIRSVIGIVIGGLYFTGMISGTVAVVLAIVGVIFNLTSAAGSCPAYVPLGLDTRNRDGVA